MEIFITYICMCFLYLYACWQIGKQFREIDKEVEKLKAELNRQKNLFENEVKRVIYDALCHDTNYRFDIRNILKKLLH